MTTSRARHIVGMDVGGANLKYARPSGEGFAQLFPLWRSPELLAEKIFQDLSRFSEPAEFSEPADGIDSVAVTMTGELADCFLDRAVGVKHIVEHTLRAAARLQIRDVAFYCVDGTFYEAQQAIRLVDQVAAANWHALATFVAREIAADATLIDVGSTTTDIIPIAERRVATRAATDHDRLLEGSLVYVGCRRTPVCALVDELTFKGHRCAVMNEIFATIDDARLLLGSVGENCDDCDSADSMPRTLQFAANRLSRMIGLDRRSVSERDAEELAQQVIAAARMKIDRALKRIGSSETVVISGHAQDLVDLPTCDQVLFLSEILGPDAVRCAPSYAVASLYLAETIGA